MQVEFGFFPKRLDIQGAGWSIATLPQFDEAMSRCVNDPNVKDGWIFSNLDPVSHYSTARLFNLPKTHSISHQSGDVDRITFILWVLSFLNGIRLSSRPNGFVDSTPVETGKLVDFILRGLCCTNLTGFPR